MQYERKNYASFFPINNTFINIKLLVVIHHYVLKLNLSLIFIIYFIYYYLLYFTYETIFN